MGQQCCGFAYFWPFGVAACAPQVLVNSIFSLTQLETWGALSNLVPALLTSESRLENFFVSAVNFSGSAVLERQLVKSWLFLLKGKVPWEALRRRRSILSGKETSLIPVALGGRGEACVLVQHVKPRK